MSIDVAMAVRIDQAEMLITIETPIASTRSSHFVATSNAVCVIA